MMSPLGVVLRQLQSHDYVLAVTLMLLAASGIYYFSRATRGLGLRLTRSSAIWANQTESTWPERRSALEGAMRMAWQIGAILGLEQGYELARGLIPHQTSLAFLNAYRLLDVEWTHGFFIESRLQETVRHFYTLMGAINVFYVVAHVAVTIGALLWIYTRRREYFPFIRSMLTTTTAIALIVFYLYPTAPPRMFYNLGFVDPTQVYHFVGEGGAQPGSYTYNPYAAMPSLHVAYALVAAWGLFLASRSTLARILTVIYPLAMSAAVLISGEHWLLDVVGAFLAVGLSRAIMALFAWVRSGRATDVRRYGRLLVGWRTGEPAG